MFQKSAVENPSHAENGFIAFYSLVINTAEVCVPSKILAALRPCQCQFVVMCLFIDLIHHPSQQPQQFSVCEGVSQTGVLVTQHLLDTELVCLWGQK